MAEPNSQDNSLSAPLFQAPDLSQFEAQKAETKKEKPKSEVSKKPRERKRGVRGKRGKAKEQKEKIEISSETVENLPDVESKIDDTEEVQAKKRRRRRRGNQDMELVDDSGDVVRVRTGRGAGPESNVSQVSGSTRLEAKRKRRKENRTIERKKNLIVQDESLARRENVERRMVVRQQEDRIQIGVLEDNILTEHFVSHTQQDSLIGNIYLGKVQNVLPSMEAAFVDIGRGRNAVLYAGEVDWRAAGIDGKTKKIEAALKPGDPVLVQVTKDPVNHKGARLTSQISLPGRYLVYVPQGSMTGISRKLPDEERSRLKKILKENLPESAGVIVRTAAEGISEEELTHDINRLRTQWEQIEKQSKSNSTRAPELLHAEPDLSIKVIRDVFNVDFSELIISGENAWDTIEAYVTYVAPELLPRLNKWESNEDVFNALRISEQINKALDSKVFLPSGGSLIIDRTEAMTVIDVNTGKFTGSGGNLEETVTKNNLEAAEEIVRQLRLRDIGGIIVIDFIDMVLETNRNLVLRRLIECLGRDRTKHQVTEITSLGLVQMTRKRMGTGLLEVFSEPCPHCAGTGSIIYPEPVEYRRAESNFYDARKSSFSKRNEKKNKRKRREKPIPIQPVENVEPSVEEKLKSVEETLDKRSDEVHAEDKKPKIKANPENFDKKNSKKKKSDKQDSSKKNSNKKKSDKKNKHKQGSNKNSSVKEQKSGNQQENQGEKSNKRHQNAQGKVKKKRALTQSNGQQLKTKIVHEDDEVVIFGI
ncbi:MAG: Rne/Rng family ribonuclease [Micrococcaceae bacterium]